MSGTPSAIAGVAVGTAAALCFGLTLTYRKTFGLAARVLFRSRSAQVQPASAVAQAQPTVTDAIVFEETQTSERSLSSSLATLRALQSTYNTLGKAEHTSFVRHTDVDLEWPRLSPHIRDAETIANSDFFKSNYETSLPGTVDERAPTSENALSECVIDDSTMSGRAQMP